MAFSQIRDLMNGCSQARFDEIDKIYNGDYYEKLEAHKAEEALIQDKRQRRRSANGVAEDPTYEQVYDEALLAQLQTTLEGLERVPENEAERFRLLTEIHQLENARENDDGEWPDVIEK